MASSRKRPHAEAEALPEQRPTRYGARKRTRMNAFGPSHASANEMGPPPTPIDPNLESFNASPTSALALDQILLPSPGPQQRPFYPKEINLAANLFQEGQPPSMRPRHLDLSPSLNSHPDPWDSQRLNGRMEQSQLMNQTYTGAREQSRQNGAPTYYGTHTTRSDIDSRTGQHIPDSGYYTQGTRSISFSGDLGSNPDCQSLAGGMPETEFPRSELQFGELYAQGPSMDGLQGYPEEQPNEYSFELICQICHTKSKNKSEFTKHKLRHDKPFKCDAEGCSRVTEGFTTQNDLDRHKKSLHNVMSGKSYMCAVPHCAKKNKVWPRADNFRQHCQRLHKDWDLNKLMDRSWDLGSRPTCNPGKDLALIEASPNDGHFLSHDPTHSQLVTLEDLNKNSSRNLPMEAYQSAKGTVLPVDMAHEATSDKLHLEPDRNYFLNLGQFTPDDHGSLDQKKSALAATGKDFSASYSTKMMPESSKSNHAIRAPVRSFTDYRTFGSNAKGTQVRANSTSRLSGLTPEDVASIASAIADRLDLNKSRSKDDIKSAIEESTLSLLGSNKSKKRSYTDSPSRNAAWETEKQLQCKYCLKKKKTQCELKKHEKRHTRPYGCTYSSCPRRFGSKDDWKRHENTMHWQVEAWKCAEPRDKPHLTTDPAHAKVQNKTKHQCGQVFYRREQFQAHLDETHKIGDAEYVRQQCKLRRVGRNGQKAFWCGFCQTVVPLQKRSLEAWDERFTHIDDKHFKNGERVEAWFPMDKELPKGILDEEKQDSSSDQEGEASGSDDVEDEFSLEEGLGVTSNISINQAKQRAKTPVREEPVVWYCCRCGHGPLSRATDTACAMQSCEHRKCGYCKRK